MERFASRRSVPRHSRPSRAWTWQTSTERMLPRTGAHRPSLSDDLSDEKKLASGRRRTHWRRPMTSGRSRDESVEVTALGAPGGGYGGRRTHDARGHPGKQCRVHADGALASAVMAHRRPHRASYAMATVALVLGMTQAATAT